MLLFFINWRIEMSWLDRTKVWLEIESLNDDFHNAYSHWEEFEASVWIDE